MTPGQLSQLMDVMEDNCVSLWMVLRGITMKEMQIYQLFTGQEVASSLSQSGPLNSYILVCGMYGW